MANDDDLQNGLLELERELASLKDERNGLRTFTPKMIKLTRATTAAQRFWIGIAKLPTQAADETWKNDFGELSRVILFEEFPLKKDSTQQLPDTWSNPPKTALKKLFPSDSFAKGNFNDLIKLYDYTAENFPAMFLRMRCATLFPAKN